MYFKYYKLTEVKQKIKYLYKVQLNIHDFMVDCITCASVKVDK